MPQQKKIRQMLAQRPAILLAHYYQKPEVQEMADILGDSLAIGIAAARCDAKVIVSPSREPCRQKSSG